MDHFKTVTNVITSISDGNSQFFSNLATLVLNEINDGYDPFVAIKRACLRNHNQNVDDLEAARRAGVKFKAGIANISFLSLMQRIMDSCCWTARSISVTRTRVDLDEAERGGIGVDYAMEAGDDVSIDASSENTVREHIDVIYESMFEAHTFLTQCKELQLNNADPLYMFSQSELDVNNNWVVTFKSDDWNEVLEHLNLTVEELNRPSTTKLDLSTASVAARLEAASTPQPAREPAAPRSSEPDFEDDELDQVAF